MDTARGPEPTILPFTAPVVHRSMPATLYGMKFRIVGPTNDVPAEGAYMVIPTVDGKSCYYLCPLTSPRD